jgi:hypothetical protein
VGRVCDCVCAGLSAEMRLRGAMPTARTRSETGVIRTTYMAACSSAFMCLPVVPVLPPPPILQVLGAEHPNSVSSMNDLAVCLTLMDQVSERVRYQQQHMRSMNHSGTPEPTR